MEEAADAVEVGEAPDEQRTARGAKAGTDCQISRRLVAGKDLWPFCPRDGKGLWPF